jgi:hypothetical protein
MSTYWVVAGIIYFRKTSKNHNLPFIILTIYTLLNMLLQIRFAILEEIIKMRKLTVWTNYGFIPFFKMFYIPKHSMEVYAYIVFGIIYFITVNSFFYLGFLFSNYIKRSGIEGE